jgi:glutamate 5-kinase
MREYEDAFAKHNIICAQVLLTRDDLRSRERFLNAKNTFHQLLQWNTIPIVNENDTVVIHELKFGDNDSLASLLTNLIEANLSINLTSTHGVLAENPLTSTLKEIPILSTIESIDDIDLNGLCGGKTSVGTGGMYSKLLSAKRTAQLGVPTLILPGKEKNIITRAFNAEPVGTWICPSQKHISRRKYWLAYQSETQGAIHIDKGAQEALSLAGKSLLPGGILSVDGNFGVGALVHIMFNDKSIAVGLTNYSATELRKIKGLKRLEVAAILGNAHYPEVIHRDNLLLNAAL